MTHFDDAGHPRMVDITGKPVTSRHATAEAIVSMQAETLAQITRGETKKGDVLAVARLAAIQATKHTATLIPLCHAIPVEGVDIEFEFPDATHVRCTATVRTTARTGVEMEALLAVSTAGLTIYDMCKSIDRQMQIDSLRVVEKSGGASGRFVRDYGSRPSSG
ncbi:cyclic pyranopterin monophosphate synthase MoaC [Candidatus Laterigemmans baculatus]|uniref:cyclic pyranopterin monophosphate synthase MoaC n=1 Tax=Candidatus Laterigemmans baculatus TaxID=2770505 RepID=UPI0013DCF1BA|nr:cyclic pyranopterin monophosphate synthase MoaC [Candidatus Laterigemmans baculatus]